MYDTNGLTLNDFYPYGEEHGDTTETNFIPLLEPIDNLIEFGPYNLTATKCVVGDPLFLINPWNNY